MTECRCIGIFTMQGCPVHDTRKAFKNTQQFLDWWISCIVGGSYEFGIDSRLVMHWKAAFNKATK